MIEIKEVKKTFGDIKALDNVSFTIKEGSIFGLVGTNGSGKSTLIRMMSGVIKPDKGKITIDDMPVYENIKAKQRLFYISDDHYFLNSGTPDDMKRYYQGIYHQFDSQRFYKMIENFGLRKKQKIQSFSKGMKKQLTMICGICANTNYLYCDEAFDGLDPVMRQAVKSILAKEIAERNLTTIIASHNLRELEDICDYVGFLHNGGVLLSKDIEDMKCNIQKIQCVLSDDFDSMQFFSELDIIKKDQRGSFYTITVRGSKEEISQILEKWNPAFAEVLPLSLEEIFISEAEGIGYDIKKIII